MVIDKNRKQSYKNRILKEINNLEEAQDVEYDNERLVAFLRKYIICEKIYKNAYSLVAKVSITNVANIKNVSVVKDSLNPIGYRINNETIRIVFGSQRINGILSCRKLRNKICHDIDNDVLNAVINNYEYLMQTMNSFINSIREQSQA